MKIAAIALALVVSPAALAQETFVPVRVPGAQSPGTPAPTGSPAPAQQPAADPTPTAPAPAESTHPGIGRSMQDPAAALQGYSLMMVSVPKPRSYRMHDLITIVVDESSKQQADQTLNTDKKYNNTANVNAMLDVMKLLELQLRQGSVKNVAALNVNSEAKLDSTGTYQRNDQFSMKIQAEVIDVKPNGVLTIEAKKVIDKNGETTTTVLSGACRPEDITASNTVFSSQLANLTLSSKNEGQVNDAAHKGIISRVLETVFAF